MHPLEANLPANAPESETTSPDGLDDPRGYRRLNAEVWVNGHEIVVLADLDEVWADREALELAEEPHNCDEMGCGWCHVVHRGTLPRAATPSAVADTAVGRLQALREHIAQEGS